MAQRNLSPIIALVSTLILGCVNTSTTQSEPEKSQALANMLTFKSINSPETDIEKQHIRSSEQAIIAGETQSISYHTLLKTGDHNGNETFGALKDFQDQPISHDGLPFLCNGTQGVIGFNVSQKGSGLDHVSYLQRNGKLYMVSQFECPTGVMYLNELQQETDGNLLVKPDTMTFISQKSGFGGWTHCAGVVTPWQSHLGSEEYEPNASNPTDNKAYQSASQLFWQGDESKNNPYYYGWIPEVSIDDTGNPIYSKHFSMGRFSHELAYVMPDNKTVYLSDDGTNAGLFMFIADKAGDLRAGKLYAAKWTQTSAENVGEATLTWVDLGHASDTQIQAALNPDNNIATTDGIKSFIFNTQTPNKDGTCPTAGSGLDGKSYKGINTANGNECLSLKDLNNDQHIDDKDITIASRLETRRIAAMKDATTEFRKEEGMTFNSRDKLLYVSMSDISNGMTDQHVSHDKGNRNDIRVKQNHCGAVYQLAVGKQVKIDSDYVAYNMKGLIAGTPSADGKQCAVDGIANPDNISFLDGSNALIIGEDSGYHSANFVWHYDINSSKLNRIATVTAGAEATSPYWYKDIHGKGYLSLTAQHPFGEAPYQPEGSTPIPAGVDVRTETGYIGPFNFSSIK